MPGAFDSTDDSESELVVEVNGSPVSDRPNAGENSLTFFKRVARTHEVKYFDVVTDEDWDKESDASDLSGEFNVVKTDKPGL